MLKYLLCVCDGEGVCVEKRVYAIREKPIVFCFCFVSDSSSSCWYCFYRQSVAVEVADCCDEGGGVVVAVK